MAPKDLSSVRSEGLIKSGFISLAWANFGVVLRMLLTAFNIHDSLFDHEIRLTI